jgi:hypothetical protein
MENSLKELGYIKNAKPQPAPILAYRSARQLFLFKKEDKKTG